MIIYGKQGSHDIAFRFVVACPHLVVHPRICELGRILSIRPLFYESFCLLWNSEIQPMHAVIVARVDDH